MRLLTSIVAAVFLLGFTGPLFAAEEKLEQDAAAGHEAKHEEKALPAAAPVVFHIGKLPVTSSTIITWAVALLLIGFAQYATRNIQQISSGAQNFWEWLVESLRDFLEGIIGRDLVRKTFWFFATIFIFILFCNWFGLIPGVGTVGWTVHFADGSEEFRPWFRGANADLNMTFAMAMIFFACWIVWAIQAN